MKSDQRRRVLFRPVELASEHHRVVLRNGEMADRKLMQVGRQLLLLEKIASLDIHIDERRLHGGDVKFLPRAVRMGEDAAIGDDHGAVSYTHLTLPTKRIV